MILYVDTSALVPLLVDEPSTTVCGELWDGADSVTCVRLGYIEAVAALAMAERMGRVTPDGMRERAVRSSTNCGPRSTSSNSIKVSCRPPRTSR